MLVYPSLQHIPTHVVVGPLGAGKTSLMKSLLAQKPPQERWAVLINEFGAIGLDAALLAAQYPDVYMAEVAGGCLCCTSGAPFQTTLSRLLQRTRPDRILIELSGLGHPQPLLRQLTSPPWQEVLCLQPVVMVVDAAAWVAESPPLLAAQQALLPYLGVLVLNKSESIPEPLQQQLSARWPHLTLYWTTQGQLPWACLPGSTQTPRGMPKPRGDERTAITTPPLLSPDAPLYRIQQQDDAWSMGWCWHPDQQLDLMTLQTWLAALPWVRAKLIVHTTAGWLSANALRGQPLLFQPSEWRRDSRLELIFEQPCEPSSLNAALLSCLSVSVLG